MKKQQKPKPLTKEYINKKIQFEEEIRKMVFQTFLLTIAGSVTLWIKEGFGLYSNSGLIISFLLLNWIVISVFTTKKLIRKWNLLE